LEWAFPSLTSQNLNPQPGEVTLEKIEESPKSLLAIIMIFVDLSKIESGKLVIDRVNFNLNKVVKSSLDLIRFSAKKKG